MDNAFMLDASHGREPKKLGVASNCSHGAGAQSQPPTRSAPILALDPATLLPDEILIKILSSVLPRDVAYAARVCRRWLPAATQLLYSTVHLSSEGTHCSDCTTKLAWTMWNAPYLRALVREIYVSIYVGNLAVDPSVDVENLLGWIALIPSETGLHTFYVWTNDDAGVSAAVLGRAPALRAVRNLWLAGPTSASLISIPLRIESLNLGPLMHLTLPPLLYLRSLSIKDASVTIAAGSTYDHLRNVELWTPTSSIELLTGLHQWAPALHTLLLPVDIRISWEDIRVIVNSLRCLPPSVRALRVCLPLALQLPFLGAIEALHVVMDPLRRGHIHDVCKLITPAAQKGNLKVVRLAGVKESQSLQKCIQDMGLGVRVEFGEVLGFSARK